MFDEPIDDIEALGEFIVIQSASGKRLTFVNALISKDGGLGGASGKQGSGKDSASGSKMFSSEMLTYMMFPATIGVVYYW